MGVLAQEATARVTEDRKGTSAACAGLAGNGGSLAQVGESNCINPGEPVGLNLPNLDLTGVITIDPESALGALGEQANEPLEQVLAAITQPLTDALAPLENTGLSGTLGAVEAQCVANPGSASGTANIVDTELTLNVAGTEVVLADLPANPEPNTEVIVDLDTALNAILDALRVNFNNALDGNLEPLEAIVGPIQDEVVNNLIDQVSSQLTPIDDNLLSITLNKQERPEEGAIEVTALEAQVLPAAQQFVDAPLAEVQVAQVGCGPSGTVPPPSGGEDPEDPVAPKPQKPEPKPEVPTVVASGVEGEPSAWYDGLLAPGALLLLASSAGLVGYRRLTA